MTDAVFFVAKPPKVARKIKPGEAGWILKGRAAKCARDEFWNETQKLAASDTTLAASWQLVS